ncbi:hypothetical protein GZ77_06520 [Endozoicomonas montiporae]|uniref:Uncharacterized protein n=2 Tax=Endozoicomonas montiporae TaxID=1027273 RepID=A0A081NCD3_9GAMM|nr:hypothetical protein [Endozoicomonas montiporae]AMO56439.1 hypothetical protein EZMO1_2343 [Endozoicomonas montiporae CL-33]KEQ16106.1 hypothetical protein GZ77_06520 [Endozoicomonas montiporae]
MKRIDVLQRLLMVLVAVIFLFRVTAVNADCDSSDFENFWTSVQKMKLSQLLAEHMALDDQLASSLLVNDLKAETREAREWFDEFVLEFPTFCKLKSLDNNSLNHALFLVLVQKREELENALDSKKLSPEYLVRMSFKAPHFITNLIAHTGEVADHVSTMEIEDRYLPYFDRVAKVLVADFKSEPEMQIRYFRLFSELLLIIDRGMDETLELFVRNIELREVARQNITAYGHSHVGGNPPRKVDPRLRGDDIGMNLSATSLTQAVYNNTQQE